MGCSGRATRMQVRDKFHIICEGDNLPPPVLQFEEMRMPSSIIRYLETKNIRRPTPIQMQARCC
jgi:ATP-dependent RNA helicase DDX41